MKLITTYVTSYRSLAGRFFHRQGFLLFAALLLSLTTKAQAPLSLPFFDDFSTASGQPGVDRPDPARWQAGSGVYINNTIAVNQPTVNVATFDGLRADGLLYVNTNQLSQGYTDTLTSRPINLDGLTRADGVYLSFYWQLRGLGELPDNNDSLTVQFLDRTGAWQTVWDTVGGVPNENFVQAFIAVDTATYLHPNFQFRFRTFSRQTGPFDTWNIDYVYLNRGRSVNDQYVKDIATRQAVGPFLKRYTAMPLTQYLVNPAAETADSVKTDITNLFNNFNRVDFQFTVQNQETGQLLQDQLYETSQNILSLGSEVKSARLTPATDLGGATQATLRYKFNMVTTDAQDPSIPGVDLRQNDSISGRVVLNDYYAYDDGTWESGVQIGPQERLAVQFIVNKPDVVSGVRASIVPFRTNQSGQPFAISVYANNNGSPGNILYQKSFTVQYPASRNGFVDFPFDRTVSVRDTFYIGYQQVSTSDTTFLRFGLDRNSPFGQRIFYSGGTTWSQNTTSPALNVQGAIMLRAVMGGAPDTLVTALPKPEPLRPLRVFPNPTAGQIHWDITNLEQVEVTDLSGRRLYEIKPTRGQQTADLSHLPDGLYLLRLQDNRRTVVQKLIIQH